MKLKTNFDNADSAPDSAPDASANAGELPLSHLERGCRAVVTAVDAPAPLDRRLEDLGLLPGTAIRMVRRAPLGDPIELELRGYRLCLRLREAALIRVRKTD